MAQRGGKRPGAGRKRGPNKVNQVRVDRARQTGSLPHEMLLTMARNFAALAAQYQPKRVAGVETNPGANESKYVEYMMNSARVSRMAAPYYASRLSTLKIVREPMDLGKLTDAELADLERIALRATDGGADQDGAGPTLQ